MIGRTSIALVTDNARLATTFAIGIALQALGSERTALTINASHLVLASIEPVTTLVAVRTARIAFALVAVASVARLIVQCLIEVTLLRQAIA